MYVSLYIVLPRVVTVAEVAWFTGGRGPVIIIVLYRRCASHGSRSSMVYGGCAWLVSKIYVSHYVKLPRIAKVAEVSEVVWFTWGRGLVIIMVA